MIGVVLGGKPVVAQYAQWDGYPEGQGAGVVDFLRGDVAKLREQCARVRLLNYGVGERMTPEEDIRQWSRELGFKVFRYILETEKPVLYSQWDFPADGLMCEWAYVVDFDTDTFEVYEGLQKEPHQTGRWHTAPGKDCFGTSYYPCKLLATFPIAAIPADWAARVMALCAGEEDG